MRDVFGYIRDILKPQEIKEWKQYKNDMGLLLNELEPYFVPDNNNQYKAIDPKTYKRISVLFDNVAKSGQEFLKAYKKVPEKTTGANNKPILTIKEVTKNLNDEFFSKGYVEYKNIKPNPHFSLKEQMDDFRYTNVEITSDEIKKIGANQSSRLQMTVNIDGKDIKGVFTEKTLFTGEKDMKEVFPRLVEKYPKYKSFFESIDVSKFYQSAAFYPANLDVLLTKKGDIIYHPDNKKSAVTSFLDKAKLDEATRNKAHAFLEDPGFYEALVDLAGQLDPIRTPATINKGALDMKDGERIDVRNSAMSAVATLINCPDLIAKSRPLVIYDENGKKFNEGTFMEFAKGKDINNLAPVDEMRLMKTSDYDTPNVKRQLANLQVLDFICGNVDRHGGNILYDVDPKTLKLKGIVGIDNDSAFFKKDIGLNDIYVRLPGVNNLKVIDEDMAETISNLSEGELKATLHGYGLDQAAINAAWKRTALLQEAIKNGDKYEDTKYIPDQEDKKDYPYITIMKKKDWEKLNIKQISKDEPNYYKTLEVMSTLPTDGNIIDPFLKRKRMVANLGLMNAMDKSQTGYMYNKLKQASPKFFASTRYKNVLAKMDEFHKVNWVGDNPLDVANDRKFTKLNELKMAVNVYKNEKKRDGFINDNWEIKKNVTGKDLNRILYVQELETYIARIEKDKEKADELKRAYAENKIKVNKVNEFLTKSEKSKKQLIEEKIQKDKEAGLIQDDNEIEVSDHISSNINASVPEVKEDNNAIKKEDVEDVIEKNPNETVFIDESALEEELGYNKSYDSNFEDSKDDLEEDYKKEDL